jgi:hypothetical protein
VTWAVGGRKGLEAGAHAWAGEWGVGFQEVA